MSPTFHSNIKINDFFWKCIKIRHFLFSQHSLKLQPGYIKKRDKQKIWLIQWYSLFLYLDMGKIWSWTSTFLSIYVVLYINSQNAMFSTCLCEIVVQTGVKFLAELSWAWLLLRPIYNVWKTCEHFFKLKM